jgi:hypothetical protein
LRKKGVFDKGRATNGALVMAFAIFSRERRENSLAGTLESGKARWRAYRCDANGMAGT